MRLVLPTGYGGDRTSWIDTKRGLNNSVRTALDALEQRAAIDMQRAAQIQRQRDEWARQERLREERERAERLDNARLTRALAEARTRREAQELRAYAAELRERLSSQDAEERDRVDAWCTWMEERADRTDPVLNLSLITGLDDERDARR